MVLSITFLIIAYCFVFNKKNVLRYIVPPMGLLFGLALSVIIGTFCPKTYSFDENSVEYVFGVSTTVKLESGNSYPIVRYYTNNKYGVLEWKEIPNENLGFVINNSIATPLLATYYLKNSGVWFLLGWPPREYWMQIFMLPVKMLPKGNIQ